MTEPKKTHPKQEPTPEERSRDQKKKTRNLRTMATITGSIGSVLFAVSSVVGIHVVQLIAACLLTISATSGAFAQILQSRETETAIEEKEAQIVSRETPPEREETILDSLRRHIQIAVNREEISMLLAERRANTLYFLGQIFLMISVLAPVGAAVIYWTIDPLPPETVTQIQSLKETLGELPSDMSITVQRDWRILLGGVSFGFLLLAAGAGLLRQQRKEIAIFFRLAERINHFERVDSVLRIRNQFRPDGHETEDTLVEFVIEQLLDRSNGGESAEEDTESDPDPKTAFDLVKAIRGVAG